MSKGRFYILRIAISGGAGVLFYLLLQLLLAALIVRNVLPEDRLMAIQIASGGLSALLGGFFAMKITGWGPAACLTGIWIAVLTVVLGFVIYDGLAWNGNTFLRIGVMLIGGSVPALLIGKKGRKRKGKPGSRRVR